MRTSANNKHNEKVNTPLDFNKGDNVMIKENPKKHNVRDLYVIKDTTAESAVLQKITNPFDETKTSQLRKKEYCVHKSAIFRTQPVQLKMNNNSKNSNRRKSNYDPVARNQSDTDSDEEEEIQEEGHFLSISEEGYETPTVEDSMDASETPPENVQRGEKSKRSKELWITKNSKLINIQEKMAARTIQRWYRRKSQKRPARKHKTAAKQKIHNLFDKTTEKEILRNTSFNSLEYRPSSAECDRQSPLDSQEITNWEEAGPVNINLEWDDHESTTELQSSVNVHELAFHAEELDLNFTSNCTDFNRVYRFDQFLSLPTPLTPTESTTRTPMTSTPVKHVYSQNKSQSVVKPKKTKAKRTLFNLSKFRKKK